MGFGEDFDELFADVFSEDFSAGVGDFFALVFFGDGSGVELFFFGFGVSSGVGEAFLCAVFDVALGDGEALLFAFGFGVGDGLSSESLASEEPSRAFKNALFFSSSVSAINRIGSGKKPIHAARKVTKILRTRRC